MPELSLEEVEHVALLARLELTAVEKTTLRADLNVIMEHFGQLLDLNTEDVPPTSHAIRMQNVFREDEPQPSLPPEAFLHEAPESRDDFFVVPRIVES